jgi:hypothetical protein
MFRMSAQLSWRLGSECGRFVRLLRDILEQISWKSKKAQVLEFGDLPGKLSRLTLPGSAFKKWKVDETVLVRSGVSSASAVSAVRSRSSIAVQVSAGNWE